MASPPSPCGGLTICTAAAFCVALVPAASLLLVERTPDFYVWKFIRPACSLSISTRAVSFLSCSVHPPSLLKLLFSSQSPPTPNILPPFSSPPVSSLYSFHLSTPMAHPHSISSLTPNNLVPAFALLLLFVSRKH